MFDTKDAQTTDTVMEWLKDRKEGAMLGWARFALCRYVYHVSIGNTHTDAKQFASVDVAENLESTARDALDLHNLKQANPLAAILCEESLGCVDWMELGESILQEAMA